MRHKLDHLKTQPGDIKVLPHPKPRKQRVLWTVDLEVIGRHGTWDWAGYAHDSTEAVELAMRDFYGPLFDDELVRQRHPVKVVNVNQVGV